MSKNNEESKQSDETDIDSASVDDESTRSAPPDANPEETEVEVSAENEPTSALEADSSSEDLLDNVRQSLIEEESSKGTKETKWWQRFGKKGKTPEREPSPSDVEIDLPPTLVQAEAVEPLEQTIQPDEYAEQIDDLVDQLKTESHESEVEASSVLDEPEIPPQPEIDLEQLKARAFQPRTAEDAQSDHDVRSIALDGGEEVFVEVEARAPDTFKERVDAFENALKPYRTYVFITLGFLGIVLAGVLSFLIYGAYQQSRPEPVREVPNLPYPVAVSLPGGWRFDLGIGTLQAGRWEPSGAEWLEGTEVCRWVSLPWSRQLEAVVRTLNQNDPIELVMSNNDRLTYGVYSVFEMTQEEIQAQDTNSPCLLLILTGSDSEKRWVLTAIP